MPGKPTEQEDEYFARLEFERKRKILDERDGPGGQRRTLARSCRGAGPMPEMRRGADPCPVSGHRAGQVLALPRALAGLR